MQRRAGRRVGRRWVYQKPHDYYFSNHPPLEENCIILNVAEFEAMRLKHNLSLNQERAAERMGVSQPTFSRILENAHKKVTNALVEGKLIKIHGGNVQYKKSFIGYACLNCDAEWEDQLATKEKKVNCPYCNSEKVYYLEKVFLNP